LGENDLLIVIAAVVIGGTALFGGKGSIIGALAGSLTIVTLNNGLVLSGLDVAQQRMALGIIILVAIALTLREGKERT
jgi:ribose transport system permease protein